jgi:hypothetical protein
VSVAGSESSTSARAERKSLYALVSPARTLVFQNPDYDFPQTIRYELKEDGSLLATELADVRELQRRLKERGVKIISEADENSTGPASFIVDPDENAILIDQHM